MRWLDGITDSVGMNLSKLRDTVEDRGAQSIAVHRVTKYQSFSISLSNEYLGLISFRIDWFEVFAVQGTLKSLLQHHNSKASILWHSAFFMSQLSHPYMTTGKKHSYDYMNVCWQSDVFAFGYAKFVIAFFSKKQVSFNFVAAIIIREVKILLCIFLNIVFG